MARTSRGHCPVAERPATDPSSAFPDDAIGKAIPYGGYGVVANDGFVSVGVAPDTPVFAATTIGAWWKQVGIPRYPDAREIFITADAGGSNGYRSHVWKQELQRLLAV